MAHRFGFPGASIDHLACQAMRTRPRSLSPEEQLGVDEILLSDVLKYMSMCYVPLENKPAFDLAVSFEG